MVPGRKPNSVGGSFPVHDSERPLVKIFVAYAPYTLVRILTQQQETGLIVFNGSHTCDKYISINCDV